MTAFVSLINFIIRNHTGRALYIIRQNPDLIYKLDFCHRSPLHWASHCKNHELVKFLIPFPFNAIKTTELSPDAPMNWIFNYPSEYLECFDKKRLIARPYEGKIYSCNLQDMLGNTPLHLSVANNSREITKLLLEHGADPTIENDQGETPSCIAGRENCGELGNLFQKPKPVSTEISEAKGKNICHRNLA